MAEVYKTAKVAALRLSWAEVIKVGGALNSFLTELLSGPGNPVAEQVIEFGG